MKPTIPSLPVCFIYPVKKIEQSNMFSGRKEVVTVPDGAYHIFQMTVTHLPKVKGVDKPQVVKDVAPRSMCGKARSEISDLTNQSEQAPQHNNVCPECSQAYKNHPRSPWRSFVRGEAIKV